MPNSPETGSLAALEVLEVAIAEVEAAERHLIEVTELARAQLHTAVTALTRVATSAWTDLESSVDLRAVAARRLYWGVPSLPPDNIAVALGYRSKREMTTAAGEVDSGVSCVDCQREIRAASRSELKELTAAGARSARGWRANDPPRCRPCKEAQRERRRQQQQWATLEDYDTIVEGPWEL